MNTAFLLLAQYNGQSVIPVETVCKDYFTHLTADVFVRKAGKGDLRHDGVSRLFEMGWNIPQVSQVSGHRTWTSLKRYTHMRQTGDKYTGWKWLDVLGVADPQPQVTHPADPAPRGPAFLSVPS